VEYDTRVRFLKDHSGSMVEDRAQQGRQRQEAFGFYGNHVEGADRRWGNRMERKE
jgi:hypothetical protein